MTLGCAPKQLRGYLKRYAGDGRMTLCHTVHLCTCFVRCRSHVGRDARHVVPGRHVAAGGGDVRRPDRG